MTQAISKVLLSGSANGQDVPIVATGTTGTTVHTSVSGESSIDLLTLTASNSSASAVWLYLEWGNTTAARNIAQQIPAKTGEYLLCSDKPLQNGLLVTAYAATTAVLNVGGSVNRVV